MTPIDTAVPLPARNGFAALGVPPPIVAALAAGGHHRPFPIQAATLPDSLAGRDVLGRGRTGSGKTIAFADPDCSARCSLAGLGAARAGPGRWSSCRPASSPTRSPT